MREALLHHIWQFKLFSTTELRTTDGLPMEIIHPGKPNHDAGPDFLEAKLRIDGTLWVGNVEIHVRTKDFISHGHCNDPNYEKLILHAVFNHDQESGKRVNCPTLEMRNFISDQLLARYSHLINTRKELPCGSSFKDLNKLVWANWLERMSVERLAQRTDKLDQLAFLLGEDLEQVLLVRLAIGFGQKVNADAFEKLARCTPWRVLAKHCNSVFQLEAILFGQAGMLIDPKDEYQQELKREYGFLQKKYDLSQMDSARWKYLRLRPANFPTIRIAQFAALLAQSMPLIANFIEVKGANSLDNAVIASEYWHTHHVFGKTTTKRVKRMGQMAWHGIMINSIIPFAVFLANRKDDTELKESWMERLRTMPPESNSVVSRFKDAGAECTSALESQAIIQLNSEYCKPGNCVNCAVGSSFLKG